MKLSRGVLSLAWVVLVTAACMAGWQSFVRAPGAATTGFSADQAYAVLSRLLAEQVPHPVGSAANRRVRDRLLGELRALGYSPEVQREFVCEQFTCTQIENVIAVLEGTGEGDAILATAHYDSVAAGPGAGDDGVGVAALLEAARLLRQRQTARNDVILLFTDGEEVGMRGARAFTRHPLFARVAVVVNLDARGTSGPAVMFETGSGNRELIALFARSVAAPVSTSVAYDLYRLLPNDTDFTIYQRQGLGGFNIAMIESVGHYHTTGDTLEALDRGSLRHYGDLLMGLLEALGPMDLAALEADGDASYFDVFGRTLVHWPAWLNLPLALLAAALLLGWVVWRWRQFAIASVAAVVLAVVAMPACLYVAGWLLAYPLGFWPDAPPVSHPVPWPARLCLMAMLFAVAMFAARLLWRAGTEVVVVLPWLVLSLLGVATAVLLPGGAYLLLWPSLLFALVLWMVGQVAPARAVMAARTAGAALAIFFWSLFPIALDALFGFRASHLKLAALLPLALALIPVFHVHGERRLAVPAAIAGAALLLAAIASQVPGRSKDYPRPLNLVYHLDADSRSASWLVQEAGVDPRFLQQAGFTPAPREFLLSGVVPAPAYTRDAADAGLRGPAILVREVEQLEAGARVHATVQAAHAGDLLGFVIAPDAGITSVRIEGQPLADAAQLAGTPLVLRIYGAGDRPLSVQFECRSDARGRLVIFERSALPATEEAMRIVQLRPADSAPLRAGDGAHVFTTVELASLHPAR